MRHIISAFVLCAMLGFGGSALAQSITLSKRTIDDVKAVCDKVGGHFTQDSNGFGCGTNCHGGPGTACVVYCRTGEKCVAQTMGGRRARTIESALKKPSRHGR